MSNSVEIDAEALAREADAAIADLPAAETQPPVDGEAPPVATGEMTQEQAQAMAQSIAPGVYLIVDAAADVIAPNWQVTKDEKTKLSDAMSMAFVLWFPDLNVPPKYLALGAVAGTLFGIASARRDASGKMKPLREPPKEVSADGREVRTAA